MRPMRGWYPREFVRCAPTARSCSHTFHGVYVPLCVPAVFVTARKLGPLPLGSRFGRVPPSVLSRSPVVSDGHECSWDVFGRHRHHLLSHGPVARSVPPHRFFCGPSDLIRVCSVKMGPSLRPSLALVRLCALVTRMGVLRLGFTR